MIILEASYTPNVSLLQGRGSTQIKEEKMETTIWDYLGFRPT